MSFAIEKGVDVTKAAGRGRPWKYPFLEMEIGDSFFVPADLAEKVRAAATSAGRRYGKKYVTRKEGNGRRVWRIA